MKEKIFNEESNEILIEELKKIFSKKRIVAEFFFLKKETIVLSQNFMMIFIHQHYYRECHHLNLTIKKTYFCFIIII